MPALDKHDSPLPTTTVKWRFPSVHPEGRKYAVGVGAAALLAFIVHWHFLGWLLVGVTIWVATFFRDPVRTTPRGDKLVVAPGRRADHDDRARSAAARAARRRTGSPTATIPAFRFS